MTNVSNITKSVSSSFYTGVMVVSNRNHFIVIPPMPVLPIILSPGGHIGSCQTALQMSSAPSSICIKLFAIVYNCYCPNTINCKNGPQNNGDFFFSAETFGLPDMRPPGPDGPHKHWDPPALNWEGGSSTYNHYH